MKLLWTSTKVHFLEMLFSFFDYLVRGLGPLLIILAIVLIGGCMYLYFAHVLPLKYPAATPLSTFGSVVYALDVLFAIYLSVCITFHYTMAVLIPPGDVTRADAERWAALEEDLAESGIGLEGGALPGVGPSAAKGERIGVGSSGSSGAKKAADGNGEGSSAAVPDGAGESTDSVNLNLVLRDEDALDELLPESSNPRQRVTDAFAPRPGFFARLDLQRFVSPPYSPAECPSYVKVGAFTKPFSTPLDDNMGLGLTIGDISVRSLRGMKYCKKCRLPKPARSHHCSVCNKCVLKMDHHCPWIANCVGHHNHRYFFLFLCYMSFTCYYYALASWPAFYSAINTSVTDTTIWPKPAFRSLMAFSWVLATIIGLAIVGLCWWQLFLVRTGLTTIDYYQWRDAVDAGKEHNMVVENFWDLGGWRQNFSWFFYVGKAHPWWHVLIPQVVPARSDGTWWPTVYDVRRASAGEARQS